MTIWFLKLSSKLCQCFFIHFFATFSCRALRREIHLCPHCLISFNATSVTHWPVTCFLDTHH